MRPCKIGIEPRHPAERSIDTGFLDYAGALKQLTLSSAKDTDLSEYLADRVVEEIGDATELYHRLVILVAPAGAGKTAALQDVHERTAAPLVNVNLELYMTT